MSNRTPRYILQRIENICAYENVYMGAGETALAITSALCSPEFQRSQLSVTPKPGSARSHTHTHSNAYVDAHINVRISNGNTSSAHQLMNTQESVSPVCTAGLKREWSIDPGGA